jgi:hypothetical protein
MKSSIVGQALASLLLIEPIVPISSAEADGGSQMNLIAIPSPTQDRDYVLVLSVCDIFFI